MIFVDESTVKVGGVVLPGLFKSLEIKGEATVEEATVEGKSAKPKQATGYEDCKVTLELILADGPKLTRLQKLAAIQKLFKQPGQAKPIVMTLVNQHTSARGISKVIFKSLTTKEQNKTDDMTVSIEFWEYVPITIKAAKAGANSGSKSSKSSSNANLNADYKQYLADDRGTAPKQSNKTSNTTAKDYADAAIHKNKFQKLNV